MGVTCLTETTTRRLAMLWERCKGYKDSPQSIPKDERDELSMMFGSTFKQFKEFAELGMRYLGFRISKIQLDIADFMQYGSSKRMIQAQRGQAKSTLAALYCIWTLIINPQARILVVSGGADQASDVALLMQRIIMQWGILCWMRPDTTKGDRASVDKFDIHFHLKGIEKSASIACAGITAQLQGRRADLLLADDIETQRNSMTQTEREKLALLTKEFSAICIHGEIMYLGTPQTKDSVYRALPQRGYDVRVWCGRYPTNEELERYGAGVQIAPLIMRELLADSTLQTSGGVEGNRGQPTDPDHINEETLQEKELEYGSEGFSLQYMLDTTLSDALRTKIKLSDGIVLDCSTTSVPEQLEWLGVPTNLVKTTTEVTKDLNLYNAVGISTIFVPFERKVMVLDPAGSGGDELAFAAGGATNSFIYLLSTGGFAGGCTNENMTKVAMKMVSLGIKELDIEQNMGHGTVRLLFLSHVENLCTKLKQNDPDVQHLLEESDLSKLELLNALTGFSVTEYYAKGQKERRIIDTISPVTRKHKLVIAMSAILEDWEYCKQHRQEQRKQYSCFYQLANITYDRKSLVHDDRADCVQRVVELLKGHLSKDAEKASIKRSEQEVRAWLDNPMGYSKSVLKQLGELKRGGRKRIMGKRR